MFKNTDLRALIYYSMPALAIALLGLPLYVYLPTFYAQDVGFGILEVGVILFISRFLDVLFDPLIGYISDRFSLRKSLMLIGSVILLIGFYFLTHPEKDVGYFWLFGFSITVYVGWSMISVPYYALGADIGENYHHNTNYASSRELFNIIGVLLALILPYAFAVAEDARSSLKLMFETIAIVLPFSMGIFFFKVHHKKIVPSLMSLKESVLRLLEEIKKSKYLFASFFLNNFANAIPATLFLLYVELVLDAAQYTGALLLLYFFSGIIALPLWIAISKKWSKKVAWQLSMASASIFFFFVPFLSQGDLALFTLITLLSGLSLGADMALPASMQADISQKHLTENCASVESTGSLFGFFAMITKLSLAFGTGASFACLALFNFDASVPTTNAITVLSMLYGFVPVILKFSAIILMTYYKEK